MATIEATDAPLIGGTIYLGGKIIKIIEEVTTAITSWI